MKRTIGGIALFGAMTLATCSALAADSAPHIDTSGVNLQPAYPATALATMERGAAVLRVGVTAAGTVSDIRLLETSGFDDLDAAAIAAVMGWKFTPAMKDNQRVAGKTNLAIAFQPPDADPSASQADVPKPAHDYLPADLTLQAQQAGYKEEARSVPCANGMLVAGVTFSPYGQNTRHWASAVNIGVSIGKPDDKDREWAGLSMVEETKLERGTAYGFGNLHAMVYYYLSVSKPSQNVVNVPFSLTSRVGTSEPLWVSWSDSGLVTSVLGGTEQHQVQMTKVPQELSMGVSGGAATFHDPQVICYPSHPPNLPS